MWRKTLGFALLALLLSLTLQGCYSHHRAHGYRDDYRPGYVKVRVKTSHRHHGFDRGHRSNGPGYRVYHRDNDRNEWRRSRKSKHRHDYNGRDWRHR
jgi:hypothetical protein